MSSSTATSNQVLLLLRRALGFVISLLLAYGVLVYVLDPYYKIHHRLDPLGKPRLMAPAVLEKLGAAHDSVLLGSSMTDNFSANKIHDTLGLNIIKLSLPGSTLHEQARVADLALTKPSIHTIVWGVDLLAARGAPDAVHPDFPMPEYLYHNDWRSFAQYLSDPSLWQDLAVGGLRTMRALRAGGKLDMEKYPQTELGEGEFGPQSVWKDFNGKVFDNAAPLSVYRYDLLLANYQQNVRRVIVANPKVRFVLLYPPYSWLAWQRMLEKGNFDNLLRFKAAMTKDLLTLPNVEVHDFQSCFEITHNLNLYRDVGHYHPDVNHRMTGWLKTGEYKLKPGEADAAVERLRKDCLEMQKTLPKN